ncbi:MAG: hypothetical protein OHM77_00950 [Candidatus Nitricoxidivorans perseverans]|uniref:Uncharacterized protein n=1 Tax=Candidatus Nitricoxidivorans perseverans TaxID=2975601 RepID=A0AA49FMB8_9PROT|nr:MAG: hypothetical protein OHM77_00950 [Candidatus Nitricoxidivorans perseverans]
MRIEQHLVAAWASQLSDKLIQDAIQSLEAMDSQEMLSGDSGLKNVWEEVCVQVQDEQSFFWETYVETIENLLAGYIEMLDKNARLALWTVTESGQDYIDDRQSDDEGDLNIPVDVDEIVAMLKESLLSVAENHESSSISRFLQRHEEGFDELEDDEEDDPEEDEDGGEDDADREPDQPEISAPIFDLRPGLSDPVFFVISRQQVEALDLDESLDFLHSLVPTAHPDHAWVYKGRLSLVISGYDTDPRELFEIPEVCRFLRALDEQWPFWLFFFNQVDDSIKLIALCLASSIEVVPGAAHIDPDGLRRFLERAFTAVNYLFESYGFPESENEALSTEVSRLFANSLISPDRDGYL